jgi:hypothetical protein
MQLLKLFLTVQNISKKKDYFFSTHVFKIRLYTFEEISEISLITKIFCVT